MMKVDRFVNTLKEIEKQPTVYYSKAGGAWCAWNGKSWNMDCVCMIKGVLWGFNFNKQAPHGGAIYGSNGVADFGANDGIEYCTEASQDFNNLIPGEYLCMRGTQHSHAGVYLGNGKVFECTVGWGVNRCIISDITKDGSRYYKGIRNERWTWHGKLKYIDYTDTPTPDYTGIITYQAYTNRWLPPVNKSDDTDDGYAGIYGESITGFKCKPQYGELIYRAHTKNGEWLPEVNSKDYDKGNDDSYAGIFGKSIDCIRIKSTKGYVTYRAHVKGGSWLPWVDSRTITGSESYAGIFGKDIDGIQMY